MTREQLQSQANHEWQHSLALRRQYPTFVFYWRERYERVYRFPPGHKVHAKRT